MSRKKEAILNFIPAVLNNTSEFIKSLMAFSEIQKAKSVVKQYGFENGLPVVDLLELLPALNSSITRYSFLDGTSHPNDLVFLKELAKSIKHCNYLEIGSWRGESLVNVVPECESAVAISLSKQEMRDMGFSERIIEMDGFFLKDFPNLKRIGHNSQTFDFSSLNQKFDLIFVDGDHTYQGVKADTASVFKLLKDENSIIVWHDCGNNYEDMRADVIAGILDGAPAEKRNSIYRVSNTLCGIYYPKKIAIKTYQPVTKPDKYFDVSIQAQKL